MTKQGLHTSFMIELDKHGNSAYPSFIPTEIDYFLDKAYLALIAKKVTGNNALSQGFEASVKRVSDLSPLIREHYSFKMNFILDRRVNYVTYDLHPDVLYLIPGTSIIYSADPVGDGSPEGEFQANVNIIPHTEVPKFKYTVNNRPWIPEPVMVIDYNTGTWNNPEGSSATIYYDTDMPFIRNFGFKYKYVKKPKLIKDLNLNESIEVNDQFALEIVAMAVSYALDNISSSRVETQPQISNNQE